MFEGVSKVLPRLHRNYGFIIHFITHNEEIPHEMEIYLEKWIHDSIPDLNFYMTVLNNQQSKIDFAHNLRIYDLWGMIDDKPKTIQEAVDKEVPFIATMNWPYNQEVTSANPEVKTFDLWYEVTKIVSEATGIYPRSREKLTGFEPITHGL